MFYINFLINFKILKNSSNFVIVQLINWHFNTYYYYKIFIILFFFLFYHFLSIFINKISMKLNLIKLLYMTKF